MEVSGTITWKTFRSKPETLNATRSVLLNRMPLHRLLYIYEHDDHIFHAKQE